MYGNFSCSYRSVTVGHLHSPHRVAWLGRVWFRLPFVSRPGWVNGLIAISVLNIDNFSWVQLGILVHYNPFVGFQLVFLVCRRWLYVD